jgi:NADH dehydrogenase/NADH:ubiquinone oxidoreductase subunit G
MKVLSCKCDDWLEFNIDFISPDLFRAEIFDKNIIANINSHKSEPALVEFVNTFIKSIKEAETTEMKDASEIKKLAAKLKADEDKATLEFEKNKKLMEAENDQVIKELAQKYKEKNEEWEADFRPKSEKNKIAAEKEATEIKKLIIERVEKEAKSKNDILISEAEAKAKAKKTAQEGLEFQKKEKEIETNAKVTIIKEMSTLFANMKGVYVPDNVHTIINSGEGDNGIFLSLFKGILAKYLDTDLEDAALKGKRHL